MTSTVCGRLSRANNRVLPLQHRRRRRHLNAMLLVMGIVKAWPFQWICRRNTHTNTCIQLHTHTHTHKYTQIHTNTNTHTYTQSFCVCFRRGRRQRKRGPWCCPILLIFNVCLPVPLSRIQDWSHPFPSPWVLRIILNNAGKDTTILQLLHCVDNNPSGIFHLCCLPMGVENMATSRSHHTTKQ